MPSMPQDEAERAALCWYLFAGPERKLAGVYRMDGLISSADAPSQVHDLFELYQENRSLSDVVSRAVEILGV